MRGTVGDGGAGRGKSGKGRGGRERQRNTRKRTSKVRIETTERGHEGRDGDDSGEEIREPDY